MFVNGTTAVCALTGQNNSTFLVDTAGQSALVVLLELREALN